MTSIHLTTQTSNNLRYSEPLRLDYKNLGIQGIGNFTAQIITNINMTKLLDTLVVSISLEWMHKEFSKLN